MNENANILLIEDEPGLVMTLTDRLEAEGYHCESTPDGTEGFRLARSGKYGAILLDVMLPGKSGFDICRDLRAARIRTPIIMLTARSQVIDRVLGLKLGADDYICKPFDMSELLARLEALLRRTAEHAEEAGTGCSDGPNTWDRAVARGRVDFGGFVADFAEGVVLREGKKHALSSLEYKLLAYLSEHPNEIISRGRLLEAVWGYGDQTEPRTVDVHVAWLRKKIGDTDPIPRHIATVRGLGYRFVP